MALETIRLGTENETTLSTEGFVQWLKENHRQCSLELLKVHFDPDLFLSEMEGIDELSILRSNDGLIAEVIHGEDQNDKSRDSTKFDLHTDGAYYERPPQFVILHCVDPGTTNIQTIFADTRSALEALEIKDIDLLKTLDYTYIGRQGKEYQQPVVEPHFESGKLISNITARGYVKPSVAKQKLHELPGMFDYVQAFQRFLSQLEKETVYRHTWKKDDLVIFDNHRFLHGRESEGIDKKRHLYRIWLSLNQL